MRLTTRTNLAMRTLMFCAVNADRVVRKHEIADACNASENHLAQVVNTLAQLGFVDTQRGRAGGLWLNRPMEQIGVGAVLRAFETGVPFAECFDEATNTCPLRAACRFRSALIAALDAFYATLDSVTLADLVRNNISLDHILKLGDARPVPACG
ncbi:Rrf2 family transcriptional regulator [Rhodobacter veldkampii DSM 11550]|uniref:Rrf2 family transcriptional regulator n=1 Tax=Phaeovulum veldkampii DSM 11550 TaxID=1185920 RepID=A0A2T4JM06_9RHOB|nr:Rrf2 family transcriptional regulator [Phaeovulum veldkampii]MBK5945937.1 Rrf2 family transcriptional regulator [Phaeovulum veldkampii DSM 11550]NCU21376.1 Rrf2 family transcriptional regulator [Candidatus Falkowbacteria bacterium]PTE18939.1 Rrf2 family transcriptional regulator [Phaeovulum veldkampii DSM 11550]TDQ64668.1 BadM/Rrf2 family transcriptional regulator [Phaeovulum veldkampii DSM 11550]